MESRLQPVNGAIDDAAVEPKQKPTDRRYDTDQNDEAYVGRIFVFHVLFICTSGVENAEP